MANYFIGDVQGCYQGLMRALAEIDFNTSKDTLWLTGDLIARGEDSLATLSYLYQHQDSIKTVLGNHDLHFLSVVNGIKKLNPNDNLGPLLASEKLPLLVDWLRQQPLIQSLPNDLGYMTHAGLPPQWQVQDAINNAKIVHDALKEQNYVSYLSKMYDNSANSWQPNDSFLATFKFTINALTRMRYCHPCGRLEFKEKRAPSEVESNLLPWFEFSPERFDQCTWVFGHWASLMGKTSHNNILALDTGYVWGNHLSVWDMERDKIMTIDADQNNNKLT